jgi:hypothetical protein
MAKGQQYFTKYQKGIVNRYYANKDAATAQKLQELVSDLALAAPGSKEADKLWKKAGPALTAAGVAPEKAERLAAGRSVEALAAAVNDLTKPR